MSRTIDNRVVEMTFDNKQFEQGIAESRSSLKQLDKDLKFDNAAQGLTNLNQAFDKLDLSNIENAVVSLQDRFSTFGIFSMQVIERLSNSIINFATNSLSKVTGQIISGGITRAMNIENAKFTMQGLLDSQEQVDDVMNSVKNSVDGTAYGLDEAAKAASMLVSTGLKTGDAVAGPLAAIAGVAAQTNSEYSRMADIFTTVAGNGRLMGQQLTQFSYYGLNAAATIADYLNDHDDLRKKLKITHQATEADIRDLVSKGKISFQLFSDAMEEAFGSHAKDANKTFTGAMSNIKAALSRIGANFVQPMIEQEGPMVRMFNSLRVMINAVNEALGPAYDFFVKYATKATEIIIEISKSLENFAKSSKFTKFIEDFVKIKVTTFVSGLANIGYSIKWIFDRLIESVSKFVKVPTIKSINQLIIGFLQLTVKLRNYITTNEDIIKIINGLAAAFNIVKNVFFAFWNIMKSIAQGLTPLAGQFLNLFGVIGDSVVAINDWITSTSILDKVVEKTNAILKPFVDFLASAYDIITNTFKSGGGGAGGVINAFFSIITRAITSTMHSIEELLGIDLTKQIGWVISKIKDLKNVVMVTAPFFNEFINFFKDLGSIIYNSFSSSSGGLEGLVNAVFNVLTRAVTTLMHAFEDLTGINLSKYIGMVIVFFRKAKETILGARDGIQELKDAIKAKWNTKEFDGLRNLFTNLKTTFESIKNIIANAVNKINESTEQVNVKGIFSIFSNIYNLLTGIASAIGRVLNDIWGLISPFITDLTDALSAGDIQKFSAIFGEFLQMLAGFRGFQAYNANIGWIIDLFKNELPNMFLTFTNAMKNTVKFPTTISVWLNAQTENIRYKQVQTMAAAVLMLAGAAYLLSKIDTADLAKAMIAVEGLLTSVAAIMYELSAIGSPGRGFTGPILALGVSILLLASAMKTISKLDPDKLQKSFETVIALIAGVAGAIAALTTTSGDLTKVAGTMVALGVSILILAAALKMLSKLDPAGLSRGFWSIVGLIAALTTSLILLMATSKGGGTLKKVATSMIGIAAAILIMSASLAILTKLDPERLQDSFLIMTFMLGEMVGALVLLSELSKSGANIGKAAATMALAAIAIAILGAALAKLTQDINPDNAAAAIIVLGLALAELAIAMTFMQDSVAGAGALMIAAVAILFMAGAFKILASIDSEGLLAGIIAMAAALAILVVAVIALTTIPGGVAMLLGIAAALLLVGLAFTALGAGVALIGAGLLLIATSLVAFAAISGVAIASAINNFATLLQGIRIIMPLVVAVIMDFTTLLLKNFANKISLFVDTFKLLLIKILDALIEITPKLGEFLITLLNMLFDVLDMAIPRLIQFLEILLENVLQFLEWGIPRLLEFILDLLMAVWDMLGVKIPELADHIATMVINLINGIAEVIREREPELKEAIENILQAVLDAILDLLGLAPGSDPVGQQIFIDFIAKMIMGIEEKKAELWYKIKEMIREAVNNVKEKLREAFDIGKNFIQGLINGIGSKINDLLSAVGNAGADVIEALVNVFQTHSPSRVTTEMGENLDQGLINGIVNLSDKMAKTAEKSGSKVIDAFSSVVDDIYSIMDSDMEFSPLITPVLDSSNLENGLSNINGMLSNSGLNVDGSYQIANDLDKDSIMDEEFQNEGTSPSVVNFTQNNYSPEALARIDIYRDTKNMLNNPALANMFKR